MSSRSGVVLAAPTTVGNYTVNLVATDGSRADSARASAVLYSWNYTVVDPVPLRPATIRYRPRLAPLQEYTPGLALHNAEFRRLTINTTYRFNVDRPAADYVIGSRGDFRIAANEVAIGLPLPRAGELMLRHRLSPAAFQRAAVLAEEFSPEQAVEAGFYDELVEPEAVLERAWEKALQLKELDLDSHRITKQRVRRELIRDIRRSVPADLGDAALLGLKRAVKR